MVRCTPRHSPIKEILFRIHVPGENIKFIRDFCIKLYNQQGQIKGYAGICQSISLDEWQHHKDAQLSELKQPQHLPTNSSLPFHNLLSSIIAPVKNSSISNTKEDSSRLYFIHTPTGKINLAKREAECLYHLCHGRSAKETGSLLFLSQRTVETYIESLKKKTESRTKIEILRKIDISGFVDHFEKIQLEPTLSH